eukprot:jgi/Ulvmu1/1850/UM012_0006.1
MHLAWSCRSSISYVYRTSCMHHCAPSAQAPLKRCQAPVRQYISLHKALAFVSCTRKSSDRPHKAPFEELASRRFSFNCVTGMPSIIFGTSATVAFHPRPYPAAGHRPRPSKRIRRKDDRERREDDRERREDDRERREDDRERRNDRRPRRQRHAPQEPPDCRELHLPPLLSFKITVFAVVLRMRELFGPMLPADIEYAAAAAADPALSDMAFTCTYDEGFCGHFSIPGNSGAAAEFDKVTEEAAPLAFIQRHLAFRPDGTDASADTAELTIFAPGLNTLHMSKEGWEGETTTPQRLQHYVQVLQRPMAQLHLGTDMDQGEVELPSTPALLGFLEAHRAMLEPGGMMPLIRDGAAFLEPRRRDAIETVLSSVGFARPLLQESVVDMLARNEEERRPLVLMPYSRSTAELSGALRRYKAAYVEAYVDVHGLAAAGDAVAAVETLLRETLTVVSVGNVDRNWPDGPAYVHLAAVSEREEGGTDPLVLERGVSAAAPDGAGADAVFVHTDGLFSGFDVHNFGAVGAPTLRLVMAMNGCRTFREMWEKERAGPLQLPGYDEVAAAVVLAGGTEWLWTPDAAYDGVTLPTREDAAELLAEWW